MNHYCEMICSNKVKKIVRIELDIVFCTSANVYNYKDITLKASILLSLLQYTA